MEQVPLRFHGSGGNFQSAVSFQSPPFPIYPMDCIIEFPEERELRSIFITAHATQTPSAITLSAHLPDRGFVPMGKIDFRDDTTATHRARQKKQIDIRVVTRTLRLTIAVCYPDLARNADQRCFLEQITCVGLSIGAKPEPRPDSIGSSSAMNMPVAAPSADNRSKVDRILAELGLSAPSASPLPQIPSQPPVHPANASIVPGRSSAPVTGAVAMPSWAQSLDTQDPLVQPLLTLVGTMSKSIHRRSEECVRRECYREGKWLHEAAARVSEINSNAQRLAQRRNYARLTQSWQAAEELKDQVLLLQRDTSLVAAALDGRDPARWLTHHAPPTLCASINALALPPGAQPPEMPNSVFSSSNKPADLTMSLSNLNLDAAAADVQAAFVAAAQRAELNESMRDAELEADRVAADDMELAADLSHRQQRDASIVPGVLPEAQARPSPFVGFLHSLYARADRVSTAVTQNRPAPSSKVLPAATPRAEALLPNTSSFLPIGEAINSHSPEPNMLSVSTRLFAPAQPSDSGSNLVEVQPAMGRTLAGQLHADFTMGLLAAPVQQGSMSGPGHAPAAGTASAALSWQTLELELHDTHVPVEALDVNTFEDDDEVPAPQAPMPALSIDVDNECEIQALLTPLSADLVGSWVRARARPLLEIFGQPLLSAFYHCSWRQRWQALTHLARALIALPLEDLEAALHEAAQKQKDSAAIAKVNIGGMSLEQARILFRAHVDLLITAVQDPSHTVFVAALSLSAQLVYRFARLLPAQELLNWMAPVLEFTLSSQGCGHALRCRRRPACAFAMTLASLHTLGPRWVAAALLTGLDESQSGSWRSLLGRTSLMQQLILAYGLHSDSALAIDSLMRWCSLLVQHRSIYVRNGAIALVWTLNNIDSSAVEPYLRDLAPLMMPRLEGVGAEDVPFIAPQSAPTPRKPGSVMVLLPPALMSPKNGNGSKSPRAAASPRPAELQISETVSASMEIKPVSVPHTPNQQSSNVPAATPSVAQATAAASVPPLNHVPSSSAAVTGDVDALDSASRSAAKSAMLWSL